MVAMSSGHPRIPLAGRQRPPPRERDPRGRRAMGAVLRVRRLAALGRRRRESGVHRRVRFGNAAAFELRASILGGLGRNLDFRCWAAGDCRWALSSALLRLAALWTRRL